jgi:hypothetical protein
MVIKAGLRWVDVAPVVPALSAVLPMFAPEIWSGFRIAQSDPVLSVIAATEQPLSVRSPGGLWAMLLVLAWFGLAYWQRRMTLWEAALVVLGGAAVLARLGNAWVYGLAMVVPLARQLFTCQVRREMLVALTGVSLAVSGYTLATTGPPALPAGVEQATFATTSGTVFADWHWAPDHQRAVGSRNRVLAAGGLVSEASEFWVDYLRITQGHERWADALKLMHVDLVILDTNASRPAADLVRASADWRVTFDADGALVAVRAAQ